MKVLSVHNFYQHEGGEDAVVCGDRQLLERAGHEVVRYWTSSKGLSASPWARIAAARSVSWSNKTLREIPDLVQDERPDVAHVHNVFPLISPAAYVALDNLAVPIVQTLHNYRFLCPGGLFVRDGVICERCADGSYYHAVAGRCNRGSFAVSAAYAAAISRHRSRGTFTGSVDVFVALTEFAKRKFVAEGFPQERFVVRPNYATQLPAEEPPSTQYRYGLYIGRLAREKGLLTLVEAAGLSGVDVRLAGEGPLDRELRRHIEELQAPARLVGRVVGEEKERLMRGACFLVLPSEWYECFPISILEAFAAGRPVICSRIGGLPEIVHDGQTGLLFEPGNAEDLADKMKCLAEDPRLVAEMGTRALTEVREKYSPEQALATLESAYERAIRARRGRGTEAHVSVGR